MLHLPSRRVTVATILVGLTLGACGGVDDSADAGADDASTNDAGTVATGNAPAPGGDEPAAAASVDTAALLDESVCAVLVGFDAGNGPLELLDTTTGEGNRSCNFSDGTSGLQVAVNVGDMRLDRGVLEEFVASGEATALDGLGDIAIAQPDFGVRAIWADQVLLFSAGYGTETLANGGRAVDLAASEAAAREVATALADQLPG
jgi:hypothetical protein